MTMEKNSENELKRKLKSIEIRMEIQKRYSEKLENELRNVYSTADGYMRMLWIDSVGEVLSEKEKRKNGQ